MSQSRIDQLTIEQYHPAYETLVEDAVVQTTVQEIVASERAKQNDELQTLRGIRVRVHELLQSRTEVPNLALAPTTDATEARAQLEAHHDHQTAHFQALWVHTDSLVQRAMGGR